MEWMLDPTAWAGFFALILLELVLGIDNLVFIAILAQKLPPHQRNNARRIGLLLALGMRIGLLASLSWMMKLTTPLFEAFGQPFSGRDLIMLVGGAFLLLKATTEIHGRLEGQGHKSSGQFKAQFWMVVSQIVVLDAVFSLDAVITAVGMVDHLSVMIGAVTVAIFVMIAIARPLTEFVMRHPTLVMLCLGFLLMVGFSLIAEGFGLHIPKGYLYAAMGFSLLVEAFNQFAFVKMKKRVRTDDNSRQKTADAILRLLGAKTIEDGDQIQEASAVLQEASRGNNVITAAEKDMMRGVLNLSERPVHTIMTPKMDVEYIDIRETLSENIEAVKKLGRSHILVVDEDLDNVMGVLRRDDFLLACIDGTHGEILKTSVLHEPVIVGKATPVMDLIDLFKKKPIEMAVVVDDTGSVEGVVTHIDLLEAIAGEFPDRDEPEFVPYLQEEDGTFIVDGMASIYDIRNTLGVDYEPDGRFGTVAGFILHDLGRFPKQGDVMEWQGWTLAIEKMDGRRIDKIRFSKLPSDSDAQE